MIEYTKQPRSEHYALAMTPAEKALIKNAARIEGKSFNEFVIQAALIQAKVYVTHIAPVEEADNV